MSNNNFTEKINTYELNFIDNFGQVRCQKIKDELNLDNLRNLDKFSFEYQKFINIIFSFSIESIEKDKEKKFEDLKNNILLNIDLNQKKNEQKEIDLIEIPKYTEGKKVIKCKLITTSLNLINDSIYAIKMLLFFNKNHYNKILLYLYEIFYNFINLSNDIVLEAKGSINHL